VPDFALHIAMCNNLHMATNLALDDKLIEAAQKAGGHCTKKESRLLSPSTSSGTSSSASSTRSGPSILIPLTTTNPSGAVPADAGSGRHSGMVSGLAAPVARPERAGAVDYAGARRTDPRWSSAIDRRRPAGAAVR
jgi:hypothetical protein